MTTTPWPHLIYPLVFVLFLLVIGAAWWCFATRLFYMQYGGHANVPPCADINTVALAPNANCGAVEPKTELHFTLENSVVDFNDEDDDDDVDVCARDRDQARFEYARF